MKKIILCLIGLIILFSGCTQNTQQQQNQNNNVIKTVCPTGIEAWASKIEFENPTTQFLNSESIFLTVKSNTNCEKKIKASLFNPKGILVSSKEYKILQGTTTNFEDFNPEKNLTPGNYTFKIEYDNQLVKTIQITVLASETKPETNQTIENNAEPLSEQPNLEKFNEYFKEIYLGKLPLGVQVGPPNFPVKTNTFTSSDQFCATLTTIKTIPEGKLGIAFYDTNSKKDIQPKTIFPLELRTGGSSSCQTLNFPPGKYEYKLYIDDILVAVIPFEIK